MTTIQVESQELAAGYTAYTDAEELTLAVRRADEELVAWTSSIGLTITVTTLIAGCGD
ncbi:LxmA leader domain family RiPP [Actinokineospora sp. UTMC 2448]|uniref:LxmA leader domain family RiPP n=1 Tax=Actinokineospora sp. UTMC 2448 TaxID=2268449 RepID=UPI00216450FA|nr:LxmA leader domain family RiPP [Actinokineospora sp. UTMC 2448]UVS81381.1 hypothetical protein Actkin_05138 [Actinokineospora sp. UTMC 2448]